MSLPRCTLLTLPYVAQNYIKYTVNMDLTRYEDGQRTTENPEGRVHPNTMWAMHRVGHIASAKKTSHHLFLSYVYSLHTNPRPTLLTLAPVVWMQHPHAQPADLPQAAVGADVPAAGVLQLHGRLQHVSHSGGLAGICASLRRH